MMCSCCSKELNKSIRKKGYKSCPNCSKKNGNIHIFYPDDLFGKTELRSTPNNLDGIQSWCCRSDINNSDTSDSIECNNL